MVTASKLPFGAAASVVGAGGVVPSACAAAGASRASAEKDASRNSLVRGRCTGFIVGTDGVFRLSRSTQVTRPLLENAQEYSGTCCPFERAGSTGPCECPSGFPKPFCARASMLRVPLTERCPYTPACTVPFEGES